MMSSRTLRERFAGSVVIALLAMAALGLAPALAHRAAAAPVLCGLYSAADTILDVDTWLAPTGKRTAIAALFVTVEDVFDVPPS